MPKNPSTKIKQIAIISVAASRIRVIVSIVSVEPNTINRLVPAAIAAVATILSMLSA